MSSLRNPEPTSDRQAIRDRCWAAARALTQRSIHPKTTACLDYYCAAMPEGRLPGRQHIDPMAMPKLLPNVWLVDVTSLPSPRFRYRLIGTRVAQTFTKDVTNRFLDEVHADFAANPMRGYLEEVVRERLPSWRKGKPNAWPTGELVKLERLYLPLASDGATVDIIFGFTLFTLQDGREI
jgi:hypothetical protein